MRRRRKIEPVGLGTLIAKVYPASQETEEAKSFRVFGAYCRSVSERVLDNARPVRFRDGVLHVNTSNAAWANALSLESSQILARMRARLPGARVSRIAFRGGPLPEMPLPAPAPPRMTSIDLKELPDNVARELAAIGNDSLRDSVAKAAATYLANVPSKKAPR